MLKKKMNKQLFVILCEGGSSVALCRILVIKQTVKKKVIQHCTLICHDKALNVIDRWICYVLKDVIHVDLYFISSYKLFFSTKTDTSKVGLLQESPATCFKGPSLKINIPLFITNCNVRVGNSRLFFFLRFWAVSRGMKKWKRC